MSLEKFMKIKKHLNVKHGMEAMINNEYQKAIDLFTLAIDSDPKDWKVYVQRCRCYHTLNNFEDALKDAQTAIDLNPEQMSGHYRRGLILMERKQFRSAEKAFQTALKCDPNDQNCKTKLKETNRLFIEEFGFKGYESDLLVNKYSNCSEISDALISGKLVQTLAALMLGSDYATSAESLRDNTDSNLLKTDTSDGSFHDLNDSSLETSTNTSVVDSDGIRKPKTIPLFRKSVTPVITPSMTPVMNGSICEDLHSTVSGQSGDNCLQTTPTNNSRIVKTRPQIFRSIKT